MYHAMLRDVPPPSSLPIGLRLTQASRVVERAFGQALAEAVGVKEATLTHHLNTMEERGLITRARDVANRRIHVVALTEEGEAAFLRLREAALAFDTRLRAGLSDSDREQLEHLLARLAANVGDTLDANDPTEVRGLTREPGL